MKIRLIAVYQEVKWYVIFWIMTAVFCISYRACLSEHIPDYVTLIAEQNAPG